MRKSSAFEKLKKGGKSSKQTLQIYYPENLESLEEYREIMVFTPVRYESIKTTVEGEIQQQQAKKTDEKIVDKTLTKAQQLASVLKETVNRLNQIKNRPIIIEDTHIFLPMPTSISFDNQVQWENANLGLSGAAAGALDILSDTGKISTFFEKAKAAIGSGAGFLEQLPGLIEAGSAIGNTTTAKLLGQRARNPFLEQLFNGVSFRTLSFNWKFIPRKAEESERLRDVILNFKKFSYPKFKSSTKLQFSFPHYWDIQFLHKIEEQLDSGGNKMLASLEQNEFLPRITKSVCNKVSVSYGEWFSHIDGAPVQTDLSLSFTEAEIITRENIEEGF